MKDNVYLDLGFMLFGIAFFIWTVARAQHQEDVKYDRMLNERREFGYRDPPSFIDTKRPRKRRWQ